MPTVNIFHKKEKLEDQLGSIVAETKEFLARELSCGDIKLGSHEVSVRLISVSGQGMLADIEVEITAHAFDERIKRQDEICLIVRDYLRQKLGSDKIMVWLLLPQLGHSWDD